MRRLRRFAIGLGVTALAALVARIVIAPDAAVGAAILGSVASLVVAAGNRGSGDTESDDGDGGGGDSDSGGDSGGGGDGGGD